MALAQVTVPLAVNLAATAVGGLAGTLKAGEDREFDIMGVAVIALCLGFGGSVLRDILLGTSPPLALRSPWYVLTVAVAATVGSLFLWTLDRVGPLLFLVDALSLGLFAVVGANKAVLVGLSFLPAVMIGTIASVGGGIMADVLMGNRPLVLRSGPPYMLASVVGTTTYVLLFAHTSVGNLAATVLAVAVTFLVRVGGWYLEWSTPSPLRDTPEMIERGRAVVRHGRWRWWRRAPPGDPEHVDEPPAA